MCVYVLGIYMDVSLGNDHGTALGIALGVAMDTDGHVHGACD